MRDRTVGKGIHTRNPLPLQVPDTEAGFEKEWLQNHFDRIVRSLVGLTRYFEDKSRPVDEYQPTPSSTEVQGTVTVQPQFDVMAERITSVMLWGPAAATGVLTLGDCAIPIVIPATGVMVLGPLGLLLERDDPRSLTLSPAGDIGLRLMGWADVRY